MFITPHNAHFLALTIGAAVISLAGCQTSSAPAAQDGAAATLEKRERTPTSISFSSDPDMISALVRQAGPMISQGGVVVMNGAGAAVIPAQEFKGIGAAAFAQRLAGAAALETAAFPAYTFLYPKGYEILASATFPMDARYGEIPASAAFGDGTRMYNVLANLSLSLGLSLVADNIVADVPTGEIAVGDAPLSTLIEALLRSARATPDAVRIESTPDYVFLHAVKNTAPADNLLNEDELSKADRDRLAAKVSFVLPEGARNGAAMVFVTQALRLSEALGPLSRQLGVSVQAAQALRDLPVNFTVLNQVSLRDALNLIVRQWPVARFGFTFKDGVAMFQPR